MIPASGSDTLYGATAGNPIPPGNRPTTSMPQYSGWRTYVSGSSVTSMLSHGLMPDTTSTNCGGKLSRTTISTRSKPIQM